MAIPSGPYRASYDFTRRKRRNPDMVISAPSGHIAIVPRYGDQRRQEAVATMLAASLDMLNAMKAAHKRLDALHDGLAQGPFYEALNGLRLAIAKAEGAANG